MSDYASAKAFCENCVSYEHDYLLQTLLLIGAILADDDFTAHELLKRLFDEVEGFEDFLFTFGFVIEQDLGRR